MLPLFVFMILLFAAVLVFRNYSFLFHSSVQAFISHGRRAPREIISITFLLPIASHYGTIPVLRKNLGMPAFVSNIFYHRRCLHEMAPQRFT